MIFNCAFLDSEETYKIIKAKGNVITLDTDGDISKCYQFNTTTGKCLNDDNTFGASRRLKEKS